MEILLAGDLVPTSSNLDLFENGSIVEHLDEKFVKKWISADYRIFNLECPICDDGKAILKYGPSLFGSSKTINGIKSLNPDLVLLANNHILDYGLDGLNQTINILNNNNISYVGIVNDSSSKNDVFIFEENNIKVGIYNICDNEFSVATCSRMGACGLDILKNYLEIKEAKEKCDYLIVVYHGGKEYYRYPSPDLKNLSEYFVEIGADIVVCQHSHCIGCCESYKNGTIIYGQGNFIFDDSDNEFEKTSLILDIVFNKNGYEVNYLPIEKDKNLIKFSSDENILLDFEARSCSIKNDKFVNEEFEKFSLNKLNNYMFNIDRFSFLKKIINKFLVKDYYVKFYNKKHLAKILNIIECSAHREVLINSLKKYLSGDMK